jgi:hypothetical protein
VLLGAAGCAASARDSDAQSTAPPAAAAPLAVASAGRPAAGAATAPAAPLAPAAAGTGHPAPAARGSAAPAPSGPTIYAASASPTVAHAGDLVAWNVRTSADVSTVTAGVRGFSLSLERHGAGHFGTAFRIPSDAPGLFHGEYHVLVTATDRDGSSAHTSMTMRFE